MFPTLPFPLPAAFPKLLADTPSVGWCFHMDRTVMPGKAEQRKKSSTVLRNSWPLTCLTQLWL